MPWIFLTLAILFACIGVAGALWGGAKALEAERLKRAGVPAEAVVVRIDREEFHTRKNEVEEIHYRYFEVISYPTAEGEREARLWVKAETEPLRAVGDKVAVRFNPANPTQVVEAEGSRQLRGAAAGIIFGLIFAGASAFIALLVSRGLSTTPVLGAAAAAVLILALSLFLMRGRIAQALPAADEAALVHSGGLLLELPDLKPYTGRVRVRGASGDVRVVRYKDGKPVEAPPAKP